MTRKIMWVDEELVNKITMLDEITEITSVQTKDLIKEFKDDIETYSDCMDEDLLQFRAHAEKVRNTYKKVVDEEIEVTYELWNSLDKKRCETHKKLEESRELSKSIKSDVKLINDTLNGSSIYGVQNYLDLVERVSNLSDKDKDLMQKLFAAQEK